MGNGYCVDCGSPIPDNQNTCSMCYGDIGHGSDGYYRRWAEEQMRQEYEEDAREEERREAANLELANLELANEEATDATGKG